MTVKHVSADSLFLRLFGSIRFPPGLLNPANAVVRSISSDIKGASAHRGKRGHRATFQHELRVIFALTFTRNTR